MSTTENKHLPRVIFDELSRGNTRAMRDAMAEDIRWVLRGGWSWSGTWEPREVVLRDLLSPLMAQFESYRSELTLMLAEDDRVVVQARSRATTRRGGLQPDVRYVFRLAAGAWSRSSDTVTRRSSSVPSIRPRRDREELRRAGYPPYRALDRSRTCTWGR